MIASAHHPTPSVQEQPKEMVVSATKLNTWLGCSLRYYFRYVLHLKKPKSAALHVGSIVHSVLERMNKARWRKEVLTNEQLQGLFEKLWIDEQNDEKVQWQPDEEPEEKTGAWKLLETYFSQSPVPLSEKIEGVEVSAEANLSAHGLPNLMGVIDLVRSGGRIVDYKTVGQTQKDEKFLHANQVQLSIYSLLYRASTEKQEGGRELHQLVKLKTPKLIITSQGPMTDKEQTRLFKQLESFQSGIERKDFIPAPSMNCMMCNFFNECRNWS